MVTNAIHVQCRELMDSSRMMLKNKIYGIVHELSVNAGTPGMVFINGRTYCPFKAQRGKRWPYLTVGDKDTELRNLDKQLQEIEHEFKYITSVMCATAVRLLEQDAISVPEQVLPYEINPWAVSDAAFLPLLSPLQQENWKRAKDLLLKWKILSLI